MCNVFKRDINRVYHLPAESLPEIRILCCELRQQFLWDHHTFLDLWSMPHFMSDLRWINHRFMLVLLDRSLLQRRHQRMFDSLSIRLSSD